MRSVTIRPACAEDAPALARLAALDSAPVPAGELLVGLVDDEPWAALSLSDGRVVADPFRRSADVAALLRERARLLEHSESRTARTAMTKIRAALSMGRLRHP